MGAFFAELKRRHIYRVAAGYAVVAWVLLQLVNNVLPLLSVPNWTGTLVLVLLVVGFPVALLFAWIHQLAPEGGTPPKIATGGLDWALMAALVAVVALVSYQQFSPRRAVPVQQAGVAAARSAAANPDSAISVAVMPFANLSGDKDQEYFSDGMTDEISGALAKIPDLRVVARTSAFQFKGKNEDARAVGQALGATHLLEGSVRKAGDQLRISAELVKADDGVTVWSNSYDRQLKDVFAVQEDIARSIAGALRMPLGIRPGALLVSDRLGDQPTHDLYLHGRALLRARDGESQFGLDILEQVVAKAPNFAPAWAMLSESIRIRTLAGRIRGGEATDRVVVIAQAEAAARKAIELDPELATGYAALGSLMRQQGKWAEAVDLEKKALALDGDDPEVLNDYRLVLWSQGYLKEALRISERLTTVEPLVWVYRRQTGEVQLANGLVDAGLRSLSGADAQAFAQRGMKSNPVIFLATVYAQQGHPAQAADTLLEYLGQAGDSGTLSKRNVEAAAQILRDVANGKQISTKLPAFNSELNFVYIYAGLPERMLDWQEASLAEGNFQSLQDTWWPLPSSVRKTERFKALVKKAGLVDYWRTHGWPDLCHPVGTDDFACE